MDSYETLLRKAIGRRHKSSRYYPPPFRTFTDRMWGEMIAQNKTRDAVHFFFKAYHPHRIASPYYLPDFVKQID